MTEGIFTKAKATRNPGQQERLEGKVRRVAVSCNISIILASGSDPRSLGRLVSVYKAPPAVYLAKRTQHKDSPPPLHAATLLLILPRMLTEVMN